MKKLFGKGAVITLRGTRRTKKIIFYAAIALVTAGGMLGLLLWAPWRQTVSPQPQPDDQAQETIFFGSQEIPVLADVPRNTYDESAFAMNGNIMIYQSEGIQTFTGVDVSEHQGEIDWYAVKAAGIDFAMIRVGWRGGTLGKLNVDSRFAYNINMAEAAGVKVGVYFFSQAISAEEAREEANLVLKWIKGYNITYPIAFDWEHLILEGGSRTDDMTGSDITDCAVAFCAVIEEAGYTPIVYMNQNLGYTYYELSRIAYFDFWLAEPDMPPPPKFYYDFKIWQYSHTGTVDGIEGDVDLNLCFVDYTAQNRE